MCSPAAASPCLCPQFRNRPILPPLDLTGVSQTPVLLSTPNKGHALYFLSGPTKAPFPRIEAREKHPHPTAVGSGGTHTLRTLSTHSFVSVPWLFFSSCGCGTPASCINFENVYHQLSPLFGVGCMLSSCFRQSLCFNILLQCLRTLVPGL